MPVCVIFNPAARGQKAQKFAGLLQSLARDCHCKPTAAAGDARLLARRAVDEGFDTIVAAGGDGTLNEVLNGIGDAPNGFARTRLGVLPLGTINVFARELEIPLDPSRAWEVILRGRETLLDLPQAEFLRGGKTVRQYFAQLGGAGLDSKAVASVDWELKKKIGPFAYVAAGIKALQQPQPKITAGNGAKSFTGELVLIGNGRFYGGTFPIFPKAEMRDGLLDVCVFRKVDWPTLLRAGIGLATKNLRRVCDFEEFQAETVALSAEKQAFLQLDGENVGELPAKISVKNGQLRMVIP